MEYVPGGELFEYVAELQRLQEDVAVYLFRQIIWALKYCHGLNIHHRDLKPENILLVHNDHRVVNVPIPGKVCGASPLHHRPCSCIHSEMVPLSQSESFNRRTFG